MRARGHYMDINKFSPKFKVSSPNLINLSGLTTEDIFDYLYAAKALKTKYRAGENPALLKHKTIALLFGNVSTRTRISFEMGIRQLGGDFLFLPKGETQLSRGESIRDTAAMFKRYGFSALILRAFSTEEIETFAKYSSLPVINGISENAHPLQILSDLFTIWEHKGKLENLKLAYIGDGNNIANTLLMGCAKCDMNITLASPNNYRPSESMLERAMQYADIQLTSDVREAVQNADIVYTDVFISMGDAESEEKKRVLSRYRVTEELMSLAKPDALFMHCMPVHRGEEVTEEVLDGPQSIVYEQAENRLHLNKAALALLVK